MTKKKKETLIVILSILGIILFMWLIMFVIGNTVHYVDRDLCKTTSGQKMFFVIPCLYFDKFNSETMICEEDYIGFATGNSKYIKHITKKYDCIRFEEDAESGVRYTLADGTRTTVTYCYFRTNCRKKTEQELEIDYCNENPNDSEKCFCEKYKMKTVYTWSCQLHNTCENGKQWIESYDMFVENWDEKTYAPQQTAISAYTMERTFRLNLDEDNNGVYNGSFTYCSAEIVNCKIVNEIEVKESVLDEFTCLSFRPKQKPIEINLEEERCVEHTMDNVKGDYGYNCEFWSNQCKDFENIFCGKADQYCCTKKEELNECEKNNPDFVEETTIITHNQTVNFLDNGSIVYHENYYNKTICREKTGKKLMVTVSANEDTLSQNELKEFESFYDTCNITESNNVGIIQFKCYNYEND